MRRESFGEIFIVLLASVYQFINEFARGLGLREAAYPLYVLAPFFGAFLVLPCLKGVLYFLSEVVAVNEGHAAIYRSWRLGFRRQYIVSLTIASLLWAYAFLYFRVPGDLTLGLMLALCGVFLLPVVLLGVLIFARHRIFRTDSSGGRTVERVGPWERAFSKRLHGAIGWWDGFPHKYFFIAFVSILVGTVVILVPEAGRFLVVICVVTLGLLVVGWMLLRMISETSDGYRGKPINERDFDEWLEKLEKDYAQIRSYRGAQAAPPPPKLSEDRDIARGDEVLDASDPAVDPYLLLGVKRGDSPDEIRRVFRIKIVEYHPDKLAHLGDEVQKLGEARARKLVAAYSRIRSGKG
ncbi:MAG: hypothetical protein ABIJ96_04825 [Elusimicrobiota bacterium]